GTFTVQMASYCPPPFLRPVGRLTISAFQALTGASLAGGLLSSSCCVVQLVLNHLQLGCAGFAVLTPWRTHFRTLTLLALGHLFYRDGVSRRSMLTMALSLSLMFSQDVVRYSNTASGFPRLKAPPSSAPASPASGSSDLQSSLPQTDSSDGLYSRVSLDATQATSVEPRVSDAAPASSATNSDTIGAKQDPLAPPKDKTTSASGGGLASQGSSPTAPESVTRNQPKAEAKTLYLRFEVEGIKCEGCAARLKAALLRQPGVIGCGVDFGGKQVQVWGRVGDMKPAMVHAAMRLVDLSYKPTLVESWEV
ncbi:hypothetical protein Agub_g1505, partial [Astrephomene gubernaculifera]